MTALSAFLGGGAFALLISYPIPDHSLYVCFWALGIGGLATVLGILAALPHLVGQASRSERIRLEQLVDRVTDKVLDDGRLRSVDN